MARFFWTTDNPTDGVRPNYISDADGPGSEWIQPFAKGLLTGRVAACADYSMWVAAVLDDDWDGDPVDVHPRNWDRLEVFVAQGDSQVKSYILGDPTEPMDPSEGGGYTHFDCGSDFQRLAGKVEKDDLAYAERLNRLVEKAKVIYGTSGYRALSKIIYDLEGDGPIGELMFTLDRQSWQEVMELLIEFRRTGRALPNFNTLHRKAKARLAR